MDQSAARPAEPMKTWTRRDKVIGMIATVAVIGAACFTYAQFRGHRDHQERADARTEVIEAASGIAVDLATISPKTAKADIESLAKRGTSEFAKQVRSNLDNQVDLIRDNKVSSNGEVTEAGIVELKDDTATVAVALRSEVTNSATAGKAEERSYRMNVVLERAEGGTWLASEVVFVP